MFEQQTITANGVEFAVLACGSGPLILCLHGFPDHARSFRAQMPALAAAGYRVVAPYMRGYAPTRESDAASRQTARLGQDAVALIEALGGKAAALVGHDWGAAAAYAAALIAPERIDRLVTMAVPYGPSFRNALLSDPAQQKRSWYMFFFQMPFAGAALAHDDFALVEQLWRDWSPGWSLEPAELAALKATFRSEGVCEAALGYYRDNFQPGRQDPALAALQGRIGQDPIAVPTTYLHGARDGCIGVDLSDGMDALFPAGLRRHVLADAGHFLHQEKPEQVNELLLDALR